MHKRLLIPAWLRRPSARVRDPHIHRCSRCWLWRRHLSVPSGWRPCHGASRSLSAGLRQAREESP